MKRRENGKVLTARRKTELIGTKQTTKTTNKVREAARSCARLYLNDPVRYAEMQDLYGAVAQTRKQDVVDNMFSLNTSSNDTNAPSPDDITGLCTWTPACARDLIHKQCRKEVTRAGSKGYMLMSSDGCLEPVCCTGLTRRLQDGVLPALTGSAIKKRQARPGHGQHFQYHASHGGSSSKIGQRIDDELRHLVQCVQNKGGIDIVKLASIGAVIPSGMCEVVARKGPTKGKTSRFTAALLPELARNSQSVSDYCQHCGLDAELYARKIPLWHRWTLAYLRDVGRKGLRLIDTQVPVAFGPTKIATELDDVAVDDMNRLVIIERKSGYKNTVGTPRKQKLNTLELCSRTGTNSDATVLLKAPYTEHTLHLLQVAVGAEMFMNHSPLLQWSRSCILSAKCRKGVRCCVVYVSGESRAPTREPGNLLECAWVWTSEDYARAAYMLLPTL